MEFNPGDGADVGTVVYPAAEAPTCRTEVVPSSAKKIENGLWKRA